MVDEQKESLKRKIAEVSEKYQVVIRAMSTKELLDDFETRALMASYSFQDPITAMMLKGAKTELIRRVKEGETSQPPEAAEAEPVSPEPKRQSLFG